MTLKQLAEDYTRIGAKLAEMESGDCSLPFPKSMFDPENAVGAAALLCFIRDLFTATEYEQFSRDKILVLLETVSRDPELFPCGIGKTMWDVEV